MNRHPRHGQELTADAPVEPQGAHFESTRRDAMPRPVLIACPHTLELVVTGFEADDLDELEPNNRLIDRPSCGQDHEWTPGDAVLAVQSGAR